MRGQQCQHHTNHRSTLATYANFRPILLLSHALMLSCPHALMPSPIQLACPLPVSPLSLAGTSTLGGERGEKRSKRVKKRQMNFFPAPRCPQATSPSFFQSKCSLCSASRGRRRRRCAPALPLSDSADSAEENALFRGGIGRGIRYAEREREKGENAEGRVRKRARAQREGWGGGRGGGGGGERKRERERRT